MGNKFTLEINLDHGDNGDSPIVAGHPLKGTVTLHVRRKIERLDLNLRLIGKESTIVSRIGIKSTHGEHIFLRGFSKLREASPGQPIKRGDYTFPFEFSMPTSLPSSTQFPRKGKAYNCRIQYLLCASMGDCKVERILSVTSFPLPIEKIFCIVPPRTYELKTFGLLKKGSISVGASVADAHVGRGENLDLSISSRNNAFVEIERVRVKLVEVIEYRAGDEAGKTKQTLDELKDVNLPCLMKNKMKASDVKRSLREFRSQIEATYQEIHQDLASGANQIQLTVPDDARDSFSGNLVTISHYLKVTFFTKALTENPSINIPIRIGNPPNLLEESRRQEEHPLNEEGRNMHSPIAVSVEDEHVVETINMNDEPDIVVSAEDVVEPNNVTEEPGIALPAHYGVPMARAVMLDRDDNVIEEEIDNQSTANETIVLGADAVFLDDDDGDQDGSSWYDRPIPPPQLPPEPSVARLVQELNFSVNDFELVSGRTQDERWLSIFASLTTTEFGTIIANVKMEYQARVAALLASVVEEAGEFTCSHCAAAIEQTSEYFRTNTLEALLPFCTDLLANHGLIRNVLSDWETIITDRMLEDAMLERQRSRQ